MDFLMVGRYLIRLQLNDPFQSLFSSYILILKTYFCASLVHPKIGKKINFEDVSRVRETVYVDLNSDGNSFKRK